LIDPFGCATVCLSRRDKEAPLRVNPEQAQAFWREGEGLTKATVLGKEVVEAILVDPSRENQKGQY